jgi:AraC-like DNA-binding protein
MPGHASPDRIVARTTDVCVGEFRCPTDHPLFRNSGPSSHYCFAFPRTAVVIRHRDGRIVADANVAMLYNRTEEYEREALSPRGDRCEWFGISPRLLRDIVAAHDRRAADDERRPIRFTHAPVAAALYLTQRCVYVRAARQDADALWLDETVADLADRVLTAAYGNVGAPIAAGRRARDLVHDARAVLARDPARAAGLASIADAVGASMFHLSRCFRLFTGQSLHQYRTQLRLRRSLEALEQGGANLTAVALDSGFSSHSHFTEAFRRTFGAPPSRVRERLGRAEPVGSR